MIYIQDSTHSTKKVKYLSNFKTTKLTLVKKRSRSPMHKLKSTYNRREFLKILWTQLVYEILLNNIKS